MEHLTALIRLITDGGWRVGFLLATGGLGVIGAHRFGIPEPGVVAPYLGIATMCATAGTAFTVVSVAAHVTSKIIAAFRSQRVEKTYQDRHRQEVMENFQTLNFDELADLRDILKSGRTRVGVPKCSRGWRLVEKGILHHVAGGAAEPICQVPDVLLNEKDELVIALDALFTKVRS